MNDFFCTSTLCMELGNLGKLKKIAMTRDVLVNKRQFCMCTLFIFSKQMRTKPCTTVIAHPFMRHCGHSLSPACFYMRPKKIPKVSSCTPSLPSIQTACTSTRVDPTDSLKQERLNPAQQAAKWPYPFNRTNPCSYWGVWGGTGRQRRA